MCGSDEHHPYPVRIFTYRIEQVRANKVQRVVVYSVHEYVSTLCVVIGVIYVRIWSFAMREHLSK